jgi:L-alanine-DL-glutamate epimerase-like enolase superfamily enzyme
MKISAIETHVCSARMRNWVFVKVLTDQPGLWGWGEATLVWHTRAVVGAIQDIEGPHGAGSISRDRHADYQKEWQQPPRASVLANQGDGRDRL